MPSVVVVGEPVVVEPADAVVVVVEPVVVEPPAEAVVEPVVVIPAEAVVVVVEPVVVLPAGAVVVVVVVPVVVVAATGAETVISAESPNIPDELSVTSSIVVPGSARVTFTVAAPSVKLTLLPVGQLPGAG